MCVRLKTIPYCMKRSCPAIPDQADGSTLNTQAVGNVAFSFLKMPAS